mmetsp:Transcript_5464/g.13520  ORF Transcript_5464/g.13520 Transcript_5464/m.13520 type:complete len:237 (+) Transcript_5464:1327-2037(+)
MMSFCPACTGRTLHMTLMLPRSCCSCSCSRLRTARSRMNFSWKSVACLRYCSSCDALFSSCVLMRCSHWSLPFSSSMSRCSLCFSASASFSRPLVLDRSFSRVCNWLRISWFSCFSLSCSSLLAFFQMSACVRMLSSSCCNEDCVWCSASSCVREAIISSSSARRVASASSFCALSCSTSLCSSSACASCDCIAACASSAARSFSCASMSASAAALRTRAVTSISASTSTGSKLYL